MINTYDYTRLFSMMIIINFLYIPDMLCMHNLFFLVYPYLINLELENVIYGGGKMAGLLF